MKVLHLVLKRKWYEQFKGLTHVCFHLGYNNQTMLFAIKEIIEDAGKEGVEKGNTCYVIKLGKEVRDENKYYRK